MRKFFDSVSGALDGRPIQNAEVRLYMSDGVTAATMYSGNGSGVIEPPLLTNTLGYFEFYATDGSYKLSVAQPGGTPKVISDVEIYDDSDQAALIARAFKVPEGETGGVFPSVATRANKFLAFDAAGNPTPLDGTGIDPGTLAQLAADGGVGLVNGAAMLLSLFSAAGTKTVPSVYSVVQTGGYAASGVGGARYIYDASVDATYVTANPRTSFVSANSRGFRLDLQQPLTIEMVGGAGDATFSSGGAALTNSPTDNLAALNAVLAIARTINTEKIAPTILLGDGNYYFSALPELHARINIIGTTTLQDRGSPTGSCILFPKSSGGFIAQETGTAGQSGTTGGVDLGTSRGSKISGVCFVGIGASSDLTKHGFQMRAPMELSARFYNIAGHGVYIAAYTNGPTPYGEVNAFGLDVYIHTCGADGVHIEGSDVNAAHLIRIATHSCGGCGVFNGSYYANRFDLGDIAGYGNTGVFNKGASYQLISNAGGGGSVEPGTNPTVWWPIAALTAANTQFPQWVSGNTYTLQCPVWDGGSGSVYSAPYMEVSSVAPFVGAPSIILGGTWKDSGTSNSIGGRGGVGVFSPQGMGGGRYLIDKTSFGYSMIGGQNGDQFAYAITGAYDSTDGSVLPRKHANSKFTQGFVYSEKWNAQGDLVYTGGGRTISWLSTGSLGVRLSTQSKFGRFSPAFSVQAFPGLAIGSLAGGYDNNHRIHQYLSAAPTSGQYAQGEFVWNLTPSAAGTLGWTCVTSGAVATASWAGSTAYNVGALVLNDSGKTYVAIRSPAWAASTAYSVGDVVTGTQGYVYQATTAGTSSTSGVGPTGVGTGITDGTVVWTGLSTQTSASSGGPTGTGTSIADGTVLWTYAPAFVFKAVSGIAA